MKRIFWGVFLMVCVKSYSGNSDRSGESGASELLLNPLARSVGINGINSARVKGIYALSTNVAGLAFATKTSFGGNYTNYLAGTGTALINLVLAQEISKGNVIGINVNSMSFGKIQKTTTLNPSGIGTFSPALLNIGVSYARLFSDRIAGGVQFKLISQGIDNISATGFAFDAGLQYSTNLTKKNLENGIDDNLHFGVYVRNVGAPMTFGGEGLTFSAIEPGEQGYKFSVSSRSQKFELPSLISIAGAYDFYFGARKSEECKPMYRLTIAGNFIYNSFMNNIYGGGVEFAVKEMISIRTGFAYEKDIFSSDAMQIQNGLAAGISFDIPMSKEKKDGSTLSIDYGFKQTRFFNHNHTFGLIYSMAHPYKMCKPILKDGFVKEKKEEKKVEVIAPKVDDVKANATSISNEEIDSVVKYAAKIKFKTGSDTFNRVGEQALTKLYDILKDYKKAKVSIDAHTDNNGDSASNMILSEKRAIAVKSFLINKGINPDSIMTNWYGDTRPVGDNTKEEGQAENRRVEIKVAF